MSTVAHTSPHQRRYRQSVDLHARDHLEKLIKKHGPPTPVSSTSSLRKLTSTSPISTSFLPPFLDSPPASPAAVVGSSTTTTTTSTATVVPSSYISASGSRPIPIPRAASQRDLDDCPITPLTGRFEQGLFISQADRSSHRAHRESRSVEPRRTTKKKTKPTSSSAGATSAHHRSSRRMQTEHRIYALGSPVSTMSTHAGHPRSPQNSPKSTPFHLNNLPRFHPAVYQSPNNTPEALSSPAMSPRPHGYRQSSGASRDALRQYRELIAGVAPLRNVATAGTSKPAKPRLDPLGSPGPVTPLTLEETEGYLSVNSNESDHDRSYIYDGATVIQDRPDRLSVKEKDRYISQRHKELKRRS